MKPIYESINRMAAEKVMDFMIKEHYLPHNSGSNCYHYEYYNKDFKIAKNGWNPCQNLNHAFMLLDKIEPSQWGGVRYSIKKYLHPEHAKPIIEIAIDGGYCRLTNPKRLALCITMTLLRVHHMPRKGVKNETTI